MLMTLYAATVNFRDNADNTLLAGSETSFAQWIGRIFNVSLVIASILVLIYLLWGAIGWITAGGDSSQIQKSRDKITQAIIGIIVLASTIAIFMLVQQFLGIEIFTFGGKATGVNTVTGGTPGVITGGPKPGSSFFKF